MPVTYTRLSSDSKDIGSLEVVYIFIFTIVAKITLQDAHIKQTYLI